MHAPFTNATTAPLSVAAGTLRHRRPSAPAPRSLTIALCAITLVGLAFPSLLAAQVNAGAPWMGLTLPDGLALPPQLAVVHDPGFAAPPSPVPEGEETHTALEAAPVLELVRQIVGFSEQSRASGERMWGRVSGLPAAAATAEWVADRFAEAGLTGVEVQRYEADAPMWWPDDWEVRLLGSDALGPGSTDVILHSAVPARGVAVPGGTLTAPLVYAGDVGGPGDVDVRGAIAIQRLDPSGGAFSQRAAISDGAAALFERGAVAVLNHIDQPGNMHVRDFAGCGVCFNIGGEDGAFLRELADRAERQGVSEALRARLFLDASEREGLFAHNTIGVVPGDSDDVMIVNAHLDGWYGAAGDNADGLAVLVALARHFAKPEHRPSRTLVFVASGGHHSAGLNGPGHVVRMNPDLAGRILLVLNLEHIAQYAVDPTTFEVRPTEQSMGWGISNLAPALVALTDEARERYGFQIREDYSNSVPGDLGQYASLGVPRVQAIHAGPLYHTSADVFESISPNGLERAARFYRFWLDGVLRLGAAEIDPEM